jgi:8-oxo-dGTP pyrophosphatase MutT (NUDIX family)
MKIANPKSQPNNHSHEKCGGIIVDSNQRRLLVVLNRQSHLKGENKWGLPKGHKHIDEDDVTCAKREIYEETGLSLQPRKFYRRIKIHMNTYFVINLKHHYNVLESLDSKEICKVAWKTPAELRMETLNRDLNIVLNYLNRAPLTQLFPQGVMNTISLPQPRRKNRQGYRVKRVMNHSQQNRDVLFANRTLIDCK